jgi:hypothetical protein
VAEHEDEVHPFYRVLYWKVKIDGLSPKKLKLVFGMEVGLMCNICCLNIDEIFLCVYISPRDHFHVEDGFQMRFI